jgi:hypothetical protein
MFSYAIMPRKLRDPKTFCPQKTYGSKTLFLPLAKILKLNIDKMIYTGLIIYTVVAYTVPKAMGNFIVKCSNQSSYSMKLFIIWMNGTSISRLAIKLPMANGTVHCPKNR